MTHRTRVANFREAEGVMQDMIRRSSGRMLKPDNELDAAADHLREAVAHFVRYFAD